MLGRLLQTLVRIMLPVHQINLLVDDEQTLGQLQRRVFLLFFFPYIKGLTLPGACDSRRYRQIVNPSSVLHVWIATACVVAWPDNMSHTYVEFKAVVECGKGR